MKTLSTEYPEYQKLKENRDESIAIFGFLEYIKRKGIVLARPHRNTSYYLPIHDVILDLVYGYFDIDTVKLDEELDSILKELQNG